VRAHGAVPATVAVIDGVPRVGLSGRAGACNTTQKQARPPRLSLCLTMTVQTIFLDEF
jgi:pseudouridine-5'-phosphate glycosidase